MQHYLELECQRKGWTQPALNACIPNSDWYSLWLRLRIEIVDEYCGESQALFPDWIYILLDDAPSAGLEWYRGIANVVMRYRQITKKWVYITEFEHADASENVQALLENMSGSTSFAECFQLCKDYLDYIADWTPLQEWIKKNYTNVRLLSAIPATFDDSINRNLLAACILTVNPDWAAITSIIETVGEIEQGEDEDAGDDSEESSQSYIQSVQSEDFDAVSRSLPLTPAYVKNLKNVAIIASILDVPLRTVILASTNVQDSKSLVETYISSDKIDWASLDSQLSIVETVFPQIDAKWAQLAVLKRCLAASRFDVIKAHLSDCPELESMALDQFKLSFDLATNPNPRNVHLIQAKACIDVCDNPTSPRVVQAKSQMMSVTDLARHSVKLPPAQIISMPVTEVISHALHQDASLYKDFDTCYAIASMLDPNVSDEDIKMLCVNRALSKLDFDTAYSYAIEEDSTWPVLFAVGNFASSQSGYSSTRLSQVLSLQTDLLANALQSCPQTQMVEVLSVWKCRDMELKDTLDDLRNSPTPPSTAPSALPFKNLLSGANTSQEFSSSSPSPTGQQQRKRDQFSSILKTGIGWMVGATEQDMAQ